jgi:hypothetical protein
MSLQLISRNEDLSRLHREGYDIEVRSGYLLVKHVPYLNAEGAIKFGTLLCPLELANENTVQPSDHTMMFAGTVPHNSTGQQLTIVASSGRRDPAPGVGSDHTFSRKPADVGNRYRDYHHKATTYVQFIQRHAQEIDPSVTAQTNALVVDNEENSVFHYRDTASTRAGIAMISEKLKVGPIAIVGLGGSGSYVLDLIAKTPVSEIHLFDGDRFIQHNAFRSPGAPAGEQLEAIPTKVDHFANIYKNMRIGIVPHPYFLDETNTDELAGMSFVFVAVDDGRARRVVVDKLDSLGISYIDVGMGIYETDCVLGGQLRITTSTPNTREIARTRLPVKDKDPNNQYATNIQIAELNALNAVLAVIKWKKLVGFYQDTDHEQNTIYVLGGNCLINEDNA